MRICIHCLNPLQKRYQIKFCSNSCQLDFQRDSYIKKWKAGEISGVRGVVATSISEHIRNYLIKKYGEKCSQCGWNKRNLLTNKVPLEIDHIDGDAQNNNEENLRILCPNCHSLTPHFRNLNKGKGRPWRKSKYLKAKSKF